MDFKAEIDEKGNLNVKAVVERKGNDVTVHLPTLPLIQKLTKQYGERNLQQI